MEDPIFHYRRVSLLASRAESHESRVDQSSDSDRREYPCCIYKVWPWCAKHSGQKKDNAEVHDVRGREGSDCILCCSSSDVTDERHDDKLQSSERACGRANNNVEALPFRECARHVLLSLVEGRRLDAKRAEIHVSLPAMMYLVVDDVEQQTVNRHLPLTERHVSLLESRGRNLFPQ